MPFSYVYSCPDYRSFYLSISPKPNTMCPPNSIQISMLCLKIPQPISFSPSVHSPQYYQFSPHILPSLNSPCKPGDPMTLHCQPIKQTPSQVFHSHSHPGSQNVRPIITPSFLKHTCFLLAPYSLPREIRGVSSFKKKTKVKILRSKGHVGLWNLHFCMCELSPHLFHELPR